MEEEQLFQFNLQQLCGIVTIESVFNVINYINTNNIQEAQFIEKEYLKQYSEFEFINSSYIYQQFIEAKQENNTVLLRLVGNAHKQARLFLANDETRSIIRGIIQERREKQ